MSQQAQMPPSVQMLQMITGFWTSCSIYTAVKLNIADLLDKKAQTAQQLAEASHSHAPSLYRLLRALASIGIFSENEKGEFSNTALSATLQSDVPGSMKALAIAQLGDHFGAWRNLVYSVKTGNTSFDNLEGMNIWQFYETHPDEGLNFIKAMSGFTQSAINAVIPMYDFSMFKTIVDVGGGNGALLIAALESAPQAKGIVFDLDYVIDETEKELIAKGFKERCVGEAGNFFESIPKGADGYLMKRVLHDWNDEQCLQILANCYAAMKPTSKLLVLDAVIPEGNTPHPGKFMDLNMMAMTGGRERTEKEFAALFAKAGLKLSRVINTQLPAYSIIEAVKG